MAAWAKRRLCTLRRDMSGEAGQCQTEVEQMIPVRGSISTWETEAGELQASQSYGVRLCLKKASKLASSASSGDVRR